MPRCASPSLILVCSQHKASMKVSVAFPCLVLECFQEASKEVSACLLVLDPSMVSAESIQRRSQRAFSCLVLECFHLKASKSISVYLFTCGLKNVFQRNKQRMSQCTFSCCLLRMLPAVRIKGGPSVPYRMCL